MTVKVKGSKKRKLSNSVFKASLIAILIAISPYIFYLYESFPSNDLWETPYFTLKLGYNKSFVLFAWVFLNKFVPLYLLIIWFFTCKHWWYHIILIPISMYTFQLIGVLNDDFRFVDDFQIYYVIPVMMIVIPIVYLIRLKIFDKIVYGIDLKEIEEELKKYEEQEKHQENTSYLDE